jgi:hypothetical protein
MRGVIERGKGGKRRREESLENREEVIRGGIRVVSDK